MPSEFQEVQRAGGEVLQDAQDAFDNGAISHETYVGIRLLVGAATMKTQPRPGALLAAGEYAANFGLDYDLLCEQVDARIYERVQIARLEPKGDERD